MTSAYSEKEVLENDDVWVQKRCTNSSNQLSKGITNRKMGNNKLKARSIKRERIQVEYLLEFFRYSSVKSRIINA